MNLSSRMVREGVAGGPAPEPDARALAQAAQFRRVLAGLGPADSYPLRMARPRSLPAASRPSRGYLPLVR